MDKTSKHQSVSRKIVGTLLIVLSIGFLAYQILNNPQDLSEIFSRSDKRILVIIVLLQLVSFGINAIISNKLLATIGQKLKFKDNLRISIMNEFGNRLMPVAGGSVTSYLGYSKLGLPTSAIIFMETALSSLTIAQYALFFSVSLLFIPHASLTIIPKVAYAGIILTILCSIAAVSFAITHRKKDIVQRCIIRGVHFLGYILPIHINEENLDEKIVLGFRKVKENFSLFFSQKTHAITILLLSSVYLAVDITMLVLSFYAFQYHISFALVTFAMLVSLLLSILTLFPGNPGVTETSFVLIFRTLGIPSNISILAVVLFRLVSYWIWLPLSTVFLIHNRKVNTANPIDIIADSRGKSSEVV